MQPRDIFLAILTSAIWGFGFAARKFGVESFFGAQLTVLRFVIAGMAVLVLPRSAIRWQLLLGVGATLYLGQFLLLFVAFQLGMPPGVASVTQQAQAFFTVLLAILLFREASVLLFGEEFSPVRLTGMLLILAGLTIILLPGRTALRRAPQP